MTALLGITLALAGESASLTTDEWATLRSGEVVVRADASTAETVSTAFVLVKTDPQDLWTEVLNFKARIPENSTLTGIREYRRDSPYDFYLAVDMSVFGADVHFTNHYQCKGYRCSYTLDPSQKNDLERCDGSYTVEAVSEGSLLTYSSVNKHHIAVPGWIRKWMAVDAVKNLMTQLKARAER